MTWLIQGKPLIINGQPPQELFSEPEIDLIKAALSRRYLREKYGKTTKTDESEKKRAGHLLEKARFHGYYPAGVNQFGDIRWLCLVQPVSHKICNSEAKITICENCGKQFKADYFLEEEPAILCRVCREKTERKGKIPF